MIRQVDWKRVAEGMIGIHSIEGRRDYFKSAVSVDGTEWPVVESTTAAGVTGPGQDQVGAGLSPASGQAPAADQKVCVWTRGPLWSEARRGCNGSLAFWDRAYPPVVCSGCGKPVKFQEQKP